MKKINKYLILKFVLFLFLTIVVEKLHAQKKTSVCQWVVSAGGSGKDIGTQIKVDSLGNAYITGYFEDSANFGNAKLKSTGARNIYVAKLNNMGQWQWAVKAGGTSNEDYGTSITIDAIGNAYITGYFKDSASFGNTKLKSIGARDIFVAKLNNKGEWEWAVKAGGTLNEDYGKAITVDINGNIYVTGEFAGTASFGSSTLHSVGSSDIFISKLDNNGNWQWTINAGSNTNDYSNSIAVDKSGNTFLTGSFQQTASFGSTTLKSVGSKDIFVAKINSNGQWQWAVPVPGQDDQVSLGISLDSSGNAYITGAFFSAVGFGGTILFTTLQSQDIFIAKINNIGQWQWAVKAGGKDSDWGKGITTDVSGNVFVTGYFKGTATFGDTNLTSYGDNFIAKLNTAGQWQWVSKTDGAGYKTVNSIIVNALGNIYLTGYYKGSIYFGNKMLTSSENEDIFIAKLTEDVQSKIYDKQADKEIGNIKLFPNPATNILTIETSKTLNSPIVITDITGRQIMLVKSSNEKTINLDISSLTKGLYFISLDQSISKFIKN